MKLYFFEPSDICIKDRRNLLFVSSLSILHFHYIKLNTFQIFNVKIPEEAINMGLPLITVWFSLNYFYYIYAEYTQWRAKYIQHIEEISAGTTEPEKMMGGGDALTNKDSFGVIKWQHTTLIPEIRELTENNIKVKTCFGTYLGLSSAINKPNGNEEVITIATKEFEKTIKNFFLSVKTDIKRIESFQKAINRYTFANKIKFYIFDLTIPALVSTIGMLLAGKFLCS